MHFARILAIVIVLFSLSCRSSLNTEVAPIEPVLAITGVPAEISSLTTVTVTVSEATGITELRWALTDQASDCGSANYGDWLKAEGSYEIAIESNGAKRLCFEAKAANGDILTKYFGWTKVTKYDFNLDGITHLSAEAPWLPVVQVDQNDCMARISDAAIDSRPARTTVINGELHLFSSCLDQDADHWSMAHARWNGTAASATWIDKNPATPTYDAFWGRNSTIENGTNKVGNNTPPILVQKSNGNLVGMFQNTGNAGIANQLSTGLHPYEASVEEGLNPANIYNAPNWFFDVGAAGEWNETLYLGKVGVTYVAPISLNIQANDQIDMYFTTKDSLDVYHTGLMQFHANDLRDDNPFPSQPIVSNYLYPKVRNVEGLYYFIGYHTVRKKIELVLGSSADTFDWDNPRRIPLEDFMTVEDKWFSSKYQVETGVTLPHVSGFEILEIGGKKTAFLIFRGGITDNFADTSVRGFGAFKIPLFE